MVDKEDFFAMDLLPEHINDGTALDRGSLTLNGSKERLQREVFGCLAERVISQYGISADSAFPDDLKMKVANAVAVVWTTSKKRYSVWFKARFCEGRTDRLIPKIFQQVKNMEPERRASWTLEQLGLNVESFIQKEKVALEEALRALGIVINTRNKIEEYLGGQFH